MVGPSSSPSKLIQMAKGIPTKGTALKLNTSRKRYYLANGSAREERCQRSVSSVKISFRRFPFAMQKRDGFDPTVNAYLFQYIADVLFDCRLRNRKLRGNSLFGRPRIIIFNTSICRGVKLNLLNFSLFDSTENSFPSGNQVRLSVRAKTARENISGGSLFNTKPCPGGVNFLPDIVIVIPTNHQEPYLWVKLFYFFE